MGPEGILSSGSIEKLNGFSSIVKILRSEKDLDFTSTFLSSRILPAKYTYHNPNSLKHRKESKNNFTAITNYSDFILYQKNLKKAKGGKNAILYTTSAVIRVCSLHLKF